MAVDVFVLDNTEYKMVRAARYSRHVEKEAWHPEKPSRIRS